MHWGTRIFALLLACACAAWQPPEALAQEEDVQLWVYGVVQGNLDEDTRLNVDGTLRWREQARGDEQQTLRFTLEQDVGDGVRIGAGGGVFETGGSTEIRPHQQINITRGRFAARTRIEQRFSDGADRMELRFRQRIRYTHPLGDGWRASIDGEFFNLVQTRRRDPNIARDQWRARTIVTHNLSDSLSFGAAYLLIYTPAATGRDRINHVPQAIVTQRF